MSNADATRAISGNFEVTMQLSQQRHLKVTGYIFTDDTIDEINKRVDVAQDVLERQFMRVDVTNKAAQIESMEANIKAIQEHTEGLVAKRKEGKSLTSQEKQQLANSGAQLDKMREIIATTQNAISAAKIKLNGASPHP